MATAEQTVTTKDVLNAIGAFKERTGLHATLPELANSLGVPVATIREAVDVLVQNGNVRYSEASGQVYAKKRPYPPTRTRKPRLSTMTSEAPERAQEATEPLKPGVELAEQGPEQAQEPGIIGGVATEGEGQAGGAEEQESSQMARTVRSFSAMRLEDEMEKERQAKMAEVERMRILQQRAVALRTANIIPILIDEIHDDATLGKLVRRLIREGVA